MPEKINWSLNVQVVGGPMIVESQTTEVEAYDKILLTVETGKTDKEVDVQPGGSGQVQLLMINLINPNQYKDAPVTYKVNDTAAGSIELDAPQLLIGKGAVGLLDPAPTKLFFSNNLNEDAAIQILVGRHVTPTP